MRERSLPTRRSRAADRLRARFRETEVLHFAFLNHILDRASNIFDRNVEVDTMLIEEIDGVNPQSLEGCLSDLPDVLGSAVQGAPLAAIPGISFPAELSRNNDPPAEWSERFPCQFFIQQRAVYL